MLRTQPSSGSAFRLVLIVLAFTPFVANRIDAQERLFTSEQAERGRDVYNASCAGCHGMQLDGRGEITSALAGAEVLGSWSEAGRTVDDLHYIISATMPPGAANTLSANQRLAVLAYILERNGYQAGGETLTDDPARLRNVRLAVQSGSGPLRRTAPEFIEGENGLNPTSSGPTQADLNAASGNSRDWLFHTHDYTGRRYVDLDQINARNAADLQPVCVYQMGDMSNFQTGPIVYGGVMYLTTTHVTVAIDAATCRPIWRHTWDVADRDVWGNNRGVAIKDGRVVRATSDGYLVALDAATGDLLWARHVGFANLGETFTMAPMIYDDLILVGPAGSENAIKGWIGAFRLENGEPVWRFNIVPKPGEPGYETWDDPPGVPVGGGAVWTPFAFDVETETLFVAGTNPAPDFPAALRGGVNLYTNALIALDVRTGTLKWYDQMVPSDDHDWDLTQVSPLFRTTVGGVERNLIGTVGKDGMLRVLDRDSHERLYETSVTTIENAKAPVTSAGTHSCPGVLGGVQWNGPSYNPTTNMLYTPAVDWCGTFYVADSVRFIAGANYLGGTIILDAEMQGWITAVDASDGSVRWRYHSPRPMIAAVTSTAGGVVFSGELTGDFFVLDARSGEELYRFNTGGSMGGGIVTYSVDGKQYVAAMSGQPSRFWVDEHPGTPTAFVFALPERGDSGDSKF